MESNYVYGEPISLSQFKRAWFDVEEEIQQLCIPFVQEGSCFDEWRCCYINTSEIPADLATKPLPAEEKRDQFCSMLLHYLVPGKDEVMIDV